MTIFILESSGSSALAWRLQLHSHDEYGECFKQARCLGELEWR